MVDESVKHTYRSIAELRLGEAVCVAYAGAAYWLQAREATGEAEGWSDLPATEFDAALTSAALWLIRQAGWRPLARVKMVDAGMDFRTLPLDLAEVLAISKQPPILIETTPEPAKLPTIYSEDCLVRAFRDTRSGLSHLALMIGDIHAQAAPLCRLHSSCVSGDILGSLRCDCGDQLALACEQISESGSGIILYIHQEGRGIGLDHKMHAYHLQDQGMDTVDANLALGFEADERDFRIASEMLRMLGIPAITLLTNNPEKIKALSQAGVDIRETKPLKPAANAHNASYLKAKRDRLGHR